MADEVTIRDARLDEAAFAAQMAVGFANAIAIAHGAVTADLARRVSSD